MQIGTLGIHLWSALYGDSDSDYVPPPPIPDKAMKDDNGNYILYNGNYMIYDL